MQYRAIIYLRCMGYLAATAAILGLAPGGATIAQTMAQTMAQTGAGAIEEIVVTARKREESLQETPISISAFSQASLEQLGVQNINDVGDFTPNLLTTVGQVANTDANFFIRGIGQFDYFSSVDPGVALYVDGVYLARTTGGNLDVGDVERIEVLRGPQGTLFGRNTIGGAVNVVLADPSEEFDGYLKVGVGERSRRNVEASLDVPIKADSLLSRFSFVYREQDGFVERFYDDARHYDVDDVIFRGQLLWRPSDVFSAKLTGDVTRSRGTGPGVINRGLTITPSPFGIPMPPDINDDLSSDRFLSFSNLEPLQEVDAYGAHLTLDWSISDAVALKSITAVRGVEQLLTLDNDGTGFAFYDLLAPTDQDQFSQELQLSASLLDGRLNSIAGLYYFTEEVDQTNGVCLGSVPVRLDPRCLRIGQNILPEIENFAVYTQHSYDVTDRLSLTAGIRASFETKEITYDFTLDNSSGLQPFFPPVVVQLLPLTTVEEDWTSVTPRLGVDFRLSDTTLVYASFAEGFRSGGFNGRPTSPESITPYDPEESTVYEVGIKSDLLDNRLRANIAVFFNDYEGIQLTNFSGGFITVDNAGDAELSGFELELTAVPVEGLRLFLGLGYLDSEYVELSPGAGGGLITLDKPLPYAPEWNINLSAEYTLTLAALGDLTLRADHAYVSEINFQPTALPGDLMGGYGVTNLRVTYQHPGERWRVSGYGRNVFDEDYDLIRFDLTNPGNVGVNTFYPAAPSEYGLELTYRW